MRQAHKRALRARRLADDRESSMLVAIALHKLLTSRRGGVSMHVSWKDVADFNRRQDDYPSAGPLEEAT